MILWWSCGWSGHCAGDAVMVVMSMWGWGGGGCNLQVAALVADDERCSHGWTVANGGLGGKFLRLR